MKTILIILLMCSVCYSGEVDIGNKKITYDNKYSFKDYTTGTLRDKTAKELKGVTIYASCFSKETPDSLIFPDGVTDLTVVNCNLDNCFIPAGVTVIGGAKRRFKVQNDRNDWLVTAQNQPIEPLNKEDYIKLGVSIDPKDLPQTMMDENILEAKEKELNEKDTDSITP